MAGHLSEETLMDLVDANADALAREHAEACPTCRARISEAAEAWAVAQATDVPEPSPFYWAAFRRQVDQRIHGERRWRRFVPFLLPLAAAAGLVWAVGGRGFSPSPMASPSRAAVLPAWSALPPVEDDPGLQVLQAVALGGYDLASAYERSGGINELLSNLSDEESRDLAARLESQGARAGVL